MTHFTILIIDHNPEEIAICQQKLADFAHAKPSNKESFELIEVNNGQDALAIIRQKNLDCILLDCTLPKTDGLVILKKIHKIKANLPVIILTECIDEQLAIKYLKNGAYDYLIKSNLPNLNLAKTIIEAIDNNQLKNDSASSKTLLIIDDNPDDREWLIRMLNKQYPQQYQCIEAISSSDGLEKMQHSLPDCILLDYSLPGITGLNLLKTINEQFPFIPVILCTAQGNETIATEAIKQGASHYLVKSRFTPDQLHITLKQSIENKILEKSLHLKNKELKQIQNKALQRERRFDRMIKATKIIVWEYDIHTQQFSVDGDLYQLIGDAAYDKGNVLTRIKNAIHPDDKAITEQLWQRYLNNPVGELDISYRIRHKNGDWHWIRKIGNISTHTAEPQRKLTGIFENINDKKREESALNQFYSLIIDSSLSTEQKIKTVLTLGLSFLDMNFAIVSEVLADQYTLKYCAPEVTEQSRNPLPLSETCCSLVFGSKEICAYNTMSQHARFHYPYSPNQIIQSYIAITLFIENRPYGTLAFMDTRPRKYAFSIQETNIIRLMGQWVSAEISQSINLKKLENTERFSRMIQNAIPDFIFVKDDQFRIIQGNPAFMEVYPESMRDSIIGTTTVESYNTEEAEAFLLQDKLALEHGYSETEETILFPDSKQRILHTKKIRFQVDQKNYILGISRDITTRKQTELELLESQQRYNLAVKGSSVGLWDWNVLTGELFWSDRFKEIVGISNPNFKARYNDFSDRLHPEDKERVETALTNHLKTKSPYDVEYRLKCNNGHYVWVHARGQAIWDTQGNAIRMAGSVDDISTRKATEEELIRSNLELERFAYVASHDLQEPLRMVANFTQLLKKHYAHQLDDRAIEYISYATNGAIRMQQLIKDLLEYARIGHDTEMRTQIDIKTLQQTVMDNLAESIQQTGATIHWDRLPNIIGPPTRIFSVFLNLISNGIKYRHPNAVPIVRVSATPQKHQWRFAIADNGIGLKQDYSEKIFEPFKRLHRKEEYAGTGMGLSICRKSIEELGGNIWVESELGKGSIFYFTLPKESVTEDEP